MVKKAISLILATEFLVALSLLVSFEFYVNLQVAFASSLFIILGASYAYKSMIDNQVESGNFEDKRDLLDEIEDPHELYDDEPINDAPAEDLDLKQIVKEERAKIKTMSVKSLKHGARGSVSFFRLIPYVFLVLGFIALENNALLNVFVYLPSLAIGIVVGSIASKELFKR